MKKSNITRIEYFLDDEDSEFIDYQCLNCFKVISVEDIEICESGNNTIKHNCESDWFRCVCNPCLIERQYESDQSDAYDFAINEAGGQEAIQEEQRKNYYLAKYGEY